MSDLSPNPLAGKTMLVVDDDEAARELMARTLTREGFAVAMAATGPEGLEAAENNPPDVVVLDVLLPEQDGWDVLAVLKQHPVLRDVPVVLVTMVDDRSKGMALGAAARQVRLMIVAQGARVLGVGIAVGAVLALAATRLLGSLLFGVETFDPVTYLAVSATMVMVGLAAAYLPARRASAVDPMDSLRSE